MQRRHALLRTLALSGVWQIRPTQASTAPALWLANTYRPGVDLSQHWVSEKFDGVRGYWDGQQLRTRHGTALVVPPWFTAAWPDTAFEGELWAGRGQFSTTVTVLQQRKPDHPTWKSLRFMVFDMPAHGGKFTERIAAYQALVAALNQAWVQAVPQTRLEHAHELQTLLARTVAQGGEGLMLRRADAFYLAGRSNDQLKVKTHEDAEARVVGHLAGTGKFAHRLGALLVETPQGLRFKLGTGLDDALRTQPPAVGDWVTYRYRGLTDSGVPRFASFVRTQPELERTP